MNWTFFRLSAPCSKHCINQRRRLQSWACSQRLCHIVLPLMKSLKGREQEIHSDFIVCFEQFFLLRNNVGLLKMANNHYYLLNINSVPGTAQSSFYTSLHFTLTPVLWRRFYYPHSTEEETETGRCREVKTVLLWSPSERSIARGKPHRSGSQVYAPNH